MFGEFQYRKDIVEIGKRIYQRGYVAANDGNISMRLGEDEVLTTPTGVSKGYMTTDMMVKVNMKGEIIEGELKPSSEIKMHIAVYNQRPDVKSVIHAHPPIATGFAVAGIPLQECVLPEVILTLGAIPVAKYGTPSTEEIPEAIREYLEDCDAFLLANHGALTVGVDLFNAYFKMETLEHFAHILMIARQLGGEKVLSPAKVSELMELRKKMNIPGKNPGCITCTDEECELDIDKISDESEITQVVTEVTKRVLENLK